MAPWPNAFMIGTDLYTDFDTLNEVLDTAFPVEPDVTFSPFAAYTDNVDGSRSGVGFPSATWKWAAKEDLQVDLLESFWSGAPSIPLYIRTFINRVDGNSDRIFRTFLTEALWIEQAEDKQAGHTLGVLLNFRHLIIQEELE